MVAFIRVLILSLITVNLYSADPFSAQGKMTDEEMKSLHESYQQHMNRMRYPDRQRQFPSMQQPAAQPVTETPSKIRIHKPSQKVKTKENKQKIAL